LIGFPDVFLKVKLEDSDAKRGALLPVGSITIDFVNPCLRIGMEEPCYFDYLKAGAG